MFCPKCGTQNPDNGKFCRSCGTDLGGLSNALATKAPLHLTDRRGRPVTCATAYNKLAMGAAFTVVAVILGISGAGRNWWFWLFIPAFMMIGSGVAQLVSYQQAKRERAAMGGMPEPQVFVEQPNPSSLPPTQTTYVSPQESRYKTGDLVPPSVTDNTTRHLESNSEGETMTLPKSNL